VRNQLLIALAGLLGAVTLMSGCSGGPAVPVAPEHPDLSGVWLGGGKASWSTARVKPGTEPDIPYTAWALERMKGQMPASGSDSDFANTTDLASR